MHNNFIVCPYCGEDFDGEQIDKAIIDPADLRKLLELVDLDPDESDVERGLWERLHAALGEA